jgi:acetyl esterase/lipase
LGCEQVHRLVLVFPLILQAACSPVTVLNAIAPRAGVASYTDIAYGSGSAHTLDIYAPAPMCENAPVVVFFFGGSWESGDRSMYRFIGAALAKRGAVVIVPDYRLYPEVRFPGFMQDAAAAVAWTIAHAASYGGDPDHLFLMGHSAGAQIATLLALDTEYLSAANVDPKIVAGVIGISGPYDFLPLTDPTLQTIFGPPEEWPLSQPINYATSRAPPMLLATGTADRTVDPANTTRLAARLRDDGVAVDERHYVGIGHAMTIGTFASPLSVLAPARRDSLDFIAAHHPTCARPRAS